jgi:hypothetical protein
MMLDILESRGVDVSHYTVEGIEIPTHSHLLGSWVEAGVMGGIFWIVVMMIVVAAIYRTLKWDAGSAALIAFVLFFAVWDILFSPFGASQRFIKAAQICIALCVLNQSSRARDTVA